MGRRHLQILPLLEKYFQFAETQTPEREGQVTNEGRAKAIIDGYQKNDPKVRLQDLFERALNEAEARGRAAGLEEAAKFTEDYGLELFGKADLSLRHGTVMLAAFAVKIRGLIPSRTELESFRVTEKEK